MATLTTTAAAIAVSAPAEDGLTLTELAAGINARLAEADTAESTAADARIAAGRMLMAAKRKVPAGYWTRWLAKHVKRSRADVYRCMALVNSEIAAEQAAARAAEKAKARASMAKTRARRAAAAPDEPQDAITAPAAAPTAEIVYLPTDGARMRPIGDPDDAPADPPRPLPFPKATVAQLAADDQVATGKRFADAVHGAYSDLLRGRWNGNPRTMAAAVADLRRAAERFLADTAPIAVPLAAAE